MQSTSTLEHSVTRDTSPLLPSPYLSQNKDENFLNQKTEEFQSILADKEKTIFALQSNIENLEKTIELLADAERTHAEKNTVLEAEIARLASENNILRNQEQILSRIVKENKQDIDLLRDNRKELVEEYERIKKEKVGVENENARRWNRIERLETAIQTHNEDIKRLENENSALKAHMKDENGDHFYFKSLEELKTTNMELKVSLGVAIACSLILAALMVRQIF